MKELFESEKYKSYLSTMSKFHNYSVNNTLQISMQMPEATLVPYIYKDKAVMRKLDSLVGDFPDTYKLVEQDEISKTYSLSKSYVSYRKPRESAQSRENGQGR